MRKRQMPRPRIPQYRRNQRINRQNNHLSLLRSKTNLPSQHHIITPHPAITIIFNSTHAYSPPASIQPEAVARSKILKNPKMTKVCRSFSTDPYLQKPIRKLENPFDNARTPFTTWVQRSAVPTFRSMTAWSSLRIPCSLRGDKRFEHDLSNRSTRISSAHGLDFSIRSFPPTGSPFQPTFPHFIPQFRLISHFQSVFRQPVPRLLRNRPLLTPFI